MIALWLIWAIAAINLVLNVVIGDHSGIQVWSATTVLICAIICARLK